MAIHGRSLVDVKKLFFDRRVVIDRVDQAHRRVLSRFGAFVRKTARRSIRNRKKVSRPGQPPSNKTGLLKKFILFSYDERKRSVVIGPALLPRMRKDNLIMLEFGGTRIVDSIRQTYRARPFMKPAFNKELDRMPGMYRDSVRQ